MSLARVFSRFQLVHIKERSQRMKIYLSLAIALSLVACASTQDGTQETASSARCVREVTTGSNMPVRRCRTAEESAQEKESGRAFASEAARGKQGVNTGK